MYLIVGNTYIGLVISNIYERQIETDSTSCYDDHAAIFLCYKSVDNKANDTYSNKCSYKIKSILS